MATDHLLELAMNKDVSEETKAVLLPILAERASTKPPRSSLYKMLTSAPFAALLSAVLVAGITEYLAFRNQGDDRIHERTIEEQKFQFEIIRDSLKEKDREQKALALQFLHDIGLIRGLDNEALTKWVGPDAEFEAPSFPDRSSSFLQQLSIQDVQTIQRRLCLKLVDGFWGPETQSAIEEFQQLVSRDPGPFSRQEYEILMAQGCTQEDTKTYRSVWEKLEYHGPANRANVEFAIHVLNICATNAQPIPIETELGDALFRERVRGFRFSNDVEPEFGSRITRGLKIALVDAAENGCD